MLKIKDTIQESKPSFLTTLLKTEILGNNLLELLYEFLLANEFKSTAKSLIKEANDLGFKVLDETFFPKEVISEETCNNILDEFKAGNWKKFFKLWDVSVPESLQSTMEYKKLTMKLRVHFAILPIRTTISSQRSLEEMQDIVNNSEDSFDSEPDVETAYDSQREASMNQLKEHLKTYGMDLINCKSCIPFFALPYLENPTSDPAVSNIFTSGWVDELTVNLKIFLFKHRKVVVTDENCKLSPKHSMTSTIITTKDPKNKEQLKQLEKNLQILDSLDLDSTEAKDTNIEEHTGNEISEFVKTPTEDLGNNFTGINGNDRNIPIFFQEVQLKEEFSYYQKTEVKIKSTQTRIQGIKNTTALLAVDELSYPVKVLDPQNLLKSPKSSTKKYEEQLMWTMSRFQHVHGNYQKLKLRFYQLHSDYQKLTDVAGELTKALENSVRGNSVHGNSVMQQVLKSCFTIFPDLFKETLRVDLKEDLVFKSEDELQTNQIKINHCFYMTPLSPKSIDFKKIKFHLTCGSLKTQLLLLQALRWKITLSQQGARDEVLHEYINNDLLGLRRDIAKNVGKQILPYILHPGEGSINILQQSAARLLNTIASLRCGRDYLSIGTATLNAIVECLNGSNDSVPDAFTYDMLLAMLQKLSLRKLQRINMIESGLVEWLIHHLNIDICKMSPYRLKYVTALLMNLSLHKKARNQASSEARLVISLLTDLLLTEHQAALPFISGALSNFLSNQQINEEGKGLGLESVLKYYRKRTSPETRDYLDHLIKVHNREENVEQIEASDNDDDECDLIEDELDEDDPIQNEAGELAGEMLLTSYYFLSTNPISSEIDKPTPEFKGLQQILHNREIIPRRFSKEKNLIRLQPVYKIPIIEEDTDFTNLLRNESQIEGEQSSKQYLTQRNSSMVNLINYTSSEDIKPQISIIDSHPDTAYDVTTIYQQQSSSINSEWSDFLNRNSESSFKNHNSKSKRISASNAPSKISKNSNQSSIKTSDEEIDLTNETSSGISKESDKITTTSTLSLPTGDESLREVPNELSSIASVETSAIKKEEEAFLAKPKLQRTPPQSAKLKGLRKLKNS